MLRDLLNLVIEGSRRALRVRTQGRSTARGSQPRWIAAATEFTLEIKEGSTLLELEGPSLQQADPEQFRQEDFLREIDPSKPAIDFLKQTLDAAVVGEESRAKEFDKQLLHFLRGFNGVFSHGVSKVEFLGADDRQDEPPVYLVPSTLERFQALEARIPPPQHVNVAGKLNMIRHSDRTFELMVGNERVKGIAEDADLQAAWGHEVLVTGTAHFAASGVIQRIEAEVVRDATKRELELFEFTPTPIGARAVRVGTSQGPRSGLGAIFGRWPGDETDEQIIEELDELS